jgi:[ribosomal protein S18]-alanine N-acetyltransferase
MKIEPLLSTDIGLALAIEREANAYPWSQSAFASSFSSDYFNYKLLDEHSTLAGFYIAQQIADQLELFNICVSKATQGKGYGQALLQHVLSEGRTRGVTEVLLEVRSSNQTAIALYQRNGFVINGLRKGYYTADAGKEDALLMHCLLG